MHKAWILVYLFNPGGGGVGLRTQPLEAMNWAEYNSRIFNVLTFPELFQYRICRISLHKNSQIFGVHAVLRVIILFLNLTNQRILSSLFGNLRNARDKTLVCKNSKRIKTRETVLLTRRINIMKNVLHCLGTFGLYFPQTCSFVALSYSQMI